jgi:hypothetical protein
MNWLQVIYFNGHMIVSIGAQNYLQLDSEAECVRLGMDIVGIVAQTEGRQETFICFPLVSGT